jgi:hypothetical protein
MTASTSVHGTTLRSFATTAHEMQKLRSFSSPVFSYTSLQSRNIPSAPYCLAPTTTAIRAEARTHIQDLRYTLSPVPPPRTRILFFCEEDHRTHDTLLTAAFEFGLGAAVHHLRVYILP